LFTFLCPQGSIPFFVNPVVVNGVTYDQYQTTDPGVGWITGKCADLGKFKVPVLRGLASRAPFFHGGEAATMRDVIVFYQNRFNMQLTNQDIQDLINFMNSL
jgi:cytochrome c peroxidase